MLVCKLCGQEFKTNLGNHLKRIHGISSSDYKERFPGSPISCSFGMASKEWRDANPDVVKRVTSAGGKAQKEKGSNLRKWCEEHPDEVKSNSRAVGLVSGVRNYTHIVQWRRDHPEENSEVHRRAIKKYFEENPERSREHYENTLLKGARERSDWYLQKQEVVVRKLRQWKEDNPERRRDIYGGNALINSKKRFNRKYKIESRFGAMVLRSSYEVKYVELCEENPLVINLEYEPVRLIVSENSTYTPDFLITLADGTKSIVEIKPKDLVDLMDPVKVQVCREYCEANGIAFDFVTEDLLFS